MNKPDATHRSDSGLRDKAQSFLEDNNQGPLIDRIKRDGYCLKEGRITIRLAEEFGFCYGVDRAIDYAYETIAKFPGHRIFLTNEIIHNPRVNAQLQQMGVIFLSGPYAGKISIRDLGKDDVVIIPAFGTTLHELSELRKRGCILVDTACGSVMSVWKRVEANSREGFTSVIHGKYDHEETRATSSRVLEYQGKYLIIRDVHQAQMVCRYIEGKGSRDRFLKEFQKAVSPGFDPDKDLTRIGCANQTTMLSSESLEIAERLQAAMLRRYGAGEITKRFRHFDTICSATQDRQDAVLKLAQAGLQLMLVVGGYNSSNTGHLVEISLKHCPTYHVEDEKCIISGERIRHKKNLASEIIETSAWLPAGYVTIGVTAGASTPNRVIEEVIRRVLEIGNAKHSS